MNSKLAFTLVEILVVVAIIALLATIAIPNLLRARVTANQTSAQATLKAISTAIETYASSNNGYPTSTTIIVGNPAYLSTDYFTGTHNGYTFAPTLTSSSYVIVAIPTASSQGIDSYTISTGSILTVNP